MSDFNDDMTSDEFDAAYETATPVAFVSSPVTVFVEQEVVATPGGGVLFTGSLSFGAANNVVQADAAILSPRPGALGALAGSAAATLAGATAA